MDGVYLRKNDLFKANQVQQFLEGKLSRKETANLLQVSERSVSRLAKRIQKEGLHGVIHRHRGRVAPNRTNTALKQRVLKLVEQKYYDLNLTHCLEVLKDQHRIQLGYGVFRRWCHERQLVKRKRRRRAQARFYRSRMPSAGYLLQLDASPHSWVRGKYWHLLLAIDDATSEIPHAQFFESESTFGCMQLLMKIIQKKGIPTAVYVDRAGWSGGQKRQDFSQFKRACEELGISVLFANSPEAKGRVERAFDTFQDRLIPELRLAKTHSIEAANRHLEKKFLPTYWNKRNVVAPRDATTAYRKVHPDLDLKQVFCIKLSRQLTRDHLFSLHNDLYAVKPPTSRSLAGKHVELRLYSNSWKGNWSVYFEDQPVAFEKVSKRRQSPPSQTEPEWMPLVRVEKSVHPSLSDRQILNRLMRIGVISKKERDTYAGKLSRRLC